MGVLNGNNTMTLWFVIRRINGSDRPDRARRVNQRCPYANYMAVLDFTAKIAAPQSFSYSIARRVRPRSVRGAIRFIRFISLIGIPCSVEPEWAKPDGIEGPFPKFRVMNQENMVFVDSCG